MEIIKNVCRRVFVHAPEDTTGSVILPVFQNTTIVWNGRLVWENYLPHDDRIDIKNSELFIPVAEGDHQFEINNDCE